MHRRFTQTPPTATHRIQSWRHTGIFKPARVDSVKRITAVEGLGHRFITMKHLPKDPAVDCYVESSHMSMKVCPLLSPENEIENFVTWSEIIKNRKQSSRESRLSSTFDNRAIAAEIQRNRQNRAAARNRISPHLEGLHSMQKMTCLGVKRSNHSLQINQISRGWVANLG